MSHHIYTTPSFVLGYHNRGEATRMLELFTKDFGRIFAHAQGVRELKSKLKYHLQPLSFSNVSLVKGREMWRVVNALERSESTPSKESQIQVLSARLAALIKRLVGEGEPVEQLFNDIEGVHIFMKEHTLSGEELRLLEIVSVLRTLSFLGYVSKEKGRGSTTISLEEVLSFSAWNRETLTAISGKETAYILTINESFAASQL